MPDRNAVPAAFFGSVRASLQRPDALPDPRARARGANQKVHAFTSIDVLDRWTAELADLRPAATGNGDNIITMFEDIGLDWWTGGGVTAKAVAAQLRAIGNRPVEVQINSFGGDMFEGIAIYNVLREHPQTVTVKVMGLAASAASIIAMAGDVVEIGAGSFLMIHNCSVVAGGNRQDFLEVANWLEPFDLAMAGVYAQRSGKPASEFTAMMDKGDVFLSGTEAIAMGLADALLSSDQLKSDPAARARAEEAHAVRAMEISLLHSGRSRSEARAMINGIKGKPGAAPEGKPDAAATELATGIASLIATISS